MSVILHIFPQHRYGVVPVADVLGLMTAGFDYVNDTANSDHD